MLIDGESPSASLPPWRTALNELARVAGLSAAVFASLYVLGLVRLVFYLGALKIPYQLVRQDPVSIASSVLLLVVPTWAVWFMWRTTHSQYKSFTESFRRQWVVLLIVIGLPVGLVVFGILRGDWSWAAQYGVIALLYAYLGTPDRSLLEGRRPLVVGVALVIAAAAFGNADALTARDRGPSTLSVRASAEQPGLSGRAVAGNGAWDYESLVFIYQDLDRLYVMQHPSRKVVVVVPLRSVSSISVAP